MSPKVSPKMSPKMILKMIPKMILKMIPKMIPKMSVKMSVKNKILKAWLLFLFKEGAYTPSGTRGAAMPPLVPGGTTPSFNLPFHPTHWKSKKSVMLFKKC